MGFSTGGYNFELAALSKKATRGKTTSDTFVYVGTNGGSVDPAGAADAVLSYYRATQRDLIPFLQVDGEYINEKHALVTASINKTKLDPSRLIPRRIDASQPVPIHTWNLCSAWQDRSELSRCNRCKRLGCFWRRCNGSSIRVFGPQEV